jgi:hypothetical protein
MTTKSRTGLLLGFTAVMMTATLSGCFIETSSGSTPRPTCSENRYFQVYWSVAESASTSPYTCSQTPAFSSVRLSTNNGAFDVGKECRATNYMGFVFDWAGSSVDGIPVGTYVIKADLIATDGVTSLSEAPSPGTQYQIPSCDPLTLAFTFDLT